jgi:hypothetical protein
MRLCHICTVFLLHLIINSALCASNNYNLDATTPEGRDNVAYLESIIQNDEVFSQRFEEGAKYFIDLDEAKSYTKRHHIIPSPAISGHIRDVYRLALRITDDRDRYLKVNEVRRKIAAYVNALPQYRKFVAEWSGKDRALAAIDCFVWNRRNIVIGPDRGENDPGSKLDMELLNALRYYKKDPSIYSDLYLGAWKAIQSQTFREKFQFFRYWLVAKKQWLYL